MSAHKQKPTITPERVQWFAAYYQQNRTWGIFHVCLFDGNYWCDAASESRVGEWTPEMREHVDWFNSLTPSQRRRLGTKAEDVANTLRRTA
jgi:hypothetical protein